jgi:hypothetical protein
MILAVTWRRDWRDPERANRNRLAMRKHRIYQARPEPIVGRIYAGTVGPIEADANLVAVRDQGRCVRACHDGDTGLAQRRRTAGMVGMGMCQQQVTRRRQRSDQGAERIRMSSCAGVE